jgi:hypothetical protein
MDASCVFLSLYVCVCVCVSQTGTNWNERMTAETSPSEYMRALIRDVRALHKILRRYLQPSVAQASGMRSARRGCACTCADPLHGTDGHAAGV